MGKTKTPKTLDQFRNGVQALLEQLDAMTEQSAADVGCDHATCLAKEAGAAPDYSVRMCKQCIDFLVQSQLEQLVTIKALSQTVETQKDAIEKLHALTEKVPALKQQVSDYETQVEGYKVQIAGNQQKAKATWNEIQALKADVEHYKQMAKGGEAAKKALKLVEVEATFYRDALYTVLTRTLGQKLALTVMESAHNYKTELMKSAPHLPKNLSNPFN